MTYDYLVLSCETKNDALSMMGKTLKENIQIVFALLPKHLISR